MGVSPHTQPGADPPPRGGEGPPKKSGRINAIPNNFRHFAPQPIPGPPAGNPPLGRGLAPDPPGIFQVKKEAWFR